MEVILLLFCSVKSEMASPCISSGVSLLPEYLSIEVEVIPSCSVSLKSEDFCWSGCSLRSFTIMLTSSSVFSCEPDDPCSRGSSFRLSSRCWSASVASDCWSKEDVQLSSFARW